MCVYTIYYINNIKGFASQQKRARCVRRQTIYFLNFFSFCRIGLIARFEMSKHLLQNMSPSVFGDAFDLFFVNR